VPLFAMLTRIPYTFLYPAVLVVTVIGVYSIDNSLFDVWLLIGFGLVGYFMRRFGYPAAPLVLALVLGPLIERSLYRTMTLNQGDFSVVFTRPISGTIMACIVLVLVGPFVWRLIAARRGATAH
jgi:putative tricarboxylic transport membrane protein